MTRIGIILLILVTLAGCERLGTERRFHVHKCRMAREFAPTKEPWQRAPFLAKECADIYRQPKCHKAFSEPSEPATMIADIVRACRDDYCPLLTEPRPELCGMADLPAATELGQAWLPLYRRILAYEVGDEGVRILEPVAKDVDATHDPSADPK